jgi:hypothetical protein
MTGDTALDDLHITQAFAGMEIGVGEALADDVIIRVRALPRWPTRWRKLVLQSLVLS